MNSPFDNFIQEMLGNRNPQGNMLTGASAPTDNFYTQALTSDYYNNQFKRPDSIDAGIATRVEEDETLYKLLGLPTTTGMFNGDSGGYDGPIGTTPTDPNAFVDLDQVNTALSVFDAFTGAVNPVVSIALSAIAAFQDPKSLFNTIFNPPTQEPAPVVNMETPYNGFSSVSPAAIAAANQTSDPLGALIDSQGWSSAAPASNVGVSAGGMSLGEMGGVY